MNVIIRKVGASTIVEIEDPEAQNQKRIYNRNCNFYAVGSKLIIEKSNPHTEIRIDFSELSDNLSQVDMESYVDEINKPAYGFFNPNVILE